MWGIRLLHYLLGRRATQVATVYVWNGRAYLPVHGRAPNGFLWETEPVLECDLSGDALGARLREVVERGHPPIDDPTRDRERRVPPIHRALHMRGWRAMTRAGVLFCMISWHPDGVVLRFSTRRGASIEELDSEPGATFPPGVDTQAIAHRIVEEWNARNAGPRD